MSEREVWITGVGAMTSLGLSMEETWARLLEGHSGAQPLEGDDTARAMGCASGAPVPPFRNNKVVKNRKSLKLMTRPVVLGCAAAKMAFEAAGMEDGAQDPERLGIFVGAGQAFADRGEIQPALEMARDGDDLNMHRYGAQGLDLIHPLWLLRGLSNNVLGFVSLDFDAQGINNNYANSGISGAQAIMGAFENIAEDRIDYSFAGSYDTALAPECLVGYGRLGMLAGQDGAHRPFDKDHGGFVPGEAGCFLMLEEASSARGRGATPLARVSGAAVTCDGYSMVEPDPEGRGLRLAIARALEVAGLEAGDIGAVFAHGASTPTSDLIEASVYRDLLGERAPSVPVTADKSGLGHSLAAGSSLSAAVAALALRDQRVPPIAGLREVAPGCEGLDYVQGAAREHSFQHALVCSLGLGGQAAALILSRV